MSSHASATLLHSTGLRRSALAVSSIILSVIVAAAVLASWGRVEALPLYAAFQAFCHQQVGRTLWLFGEPLPVCARCLGVYVGAFGAALAGARFSGRAFAMALLAVLSTWAGESWGLLAQVPVLRLFTGITLGFTAVAAVVGPVGGKPRPDHPGTRRSC